MITFLWLDGPKRWHVSMSEGLMLMPSPSKVFSLVSSKELLIALSRMLTIFKHSLLDHCLLPQDFRSTWINWLSKNFVDVNGDSKFSFKLREVYPQFTEILFRLKLSWQSRVTLIISFLEFFLRAFFVRGISIKITSVSYLKHFTSYNNLQTYLHAHSLTLFKINLFL